MTYFLYWVGLFILGFCICLSFKMRESENNELPFSEEQLFQVLIILLTIGFIIIAATIPFINYKTTQEYNRTYLKIK